AAARLFSSTRTRAVWAAPAVSALLPGIGKDRELLPPVRIRRAFRRLREHGAGIRADVARVVTTEEVLDMSPRRELTVRKDLRVLVRLAEGQTILGDVASRDRPAVRQRDVADRIGLSGRRRRGREEAAILRDPELRELRIRLLVDRRVNAGSRDTDATNGDRVVVDFRRVA